MTVTASAPDVVVAVTSVGAAIERKPVSQALFALSETAFAATYLKSPCEGPTCEWVVAWNMRHDTSI